MRDIILIFISYSFMKWSKQFITHITVSIQYVILVTSLLCNFKLFRYPYHSSYHIISFHFLLSLLCSESLSPADAQFWTSTEHNIRNFEQRLITHTTYMFLSRNRFWVLDFFHNVDDFGWCGCQGHSYALLLNNILLSQDIVQYIILHSINIIYCKAKKYCTFI